MRRNPSSTKPEESSSWIYFSLTWLQLQFLVLQCFFYKFSNDPFVIGVFLLYITLFCYISTLHMKIKLLAFILVSLAPFWSLLG